MGIVIKQLLILSRRVCMRVSVCQLLIQLLPPLVTGMANALVPLTAQVVPRARAAAVMRPLHGGHRRVVRPSAASKYFMLNLLTIAWESSSGSAAERGALSMLVSWSQPCWTGAAGARSGCL